MKVKVAPDELSVYYGVFGKNPQAAWVALSAGFNKGRFKFPFLRGDLVFTNNHDSWLANVIRWKDRKMGNVPIVSNHIEMYLLNGHAIGANMEGIAINPMERFFKGEHDVIVLRDLKLGEAQRDKLVYESMLKLHQKYDFKGLVWQLLDGVTRSTYFSKKKNDSELCYCSEYVRRIFSTALNSELTDLSIGVDTPNNIFKGCIEREWKTIFSMVKQGEIWEINHESIES